MSSVLLLDRIVILQPNARQDPGPNHNYCKSNHPERGDGFLEEYHAVDCREGKVGSVRQRRPGDRPAFVHPLQEGCHHGGVGSYHEEQTRASQTQLDAFAYMPTRYGGVDESGDDNLDGNEPIAQTSRAGLDRRCWVEGNFADARRRRSKKS